MDCDFLKLIDTAWNLIVASDTGKYFLLEPNDGGDLLNLKYLWTIWSLNHSKWGVWMVVNRPAGLYSRSCSPAMHACMFCKWGIFIIIYTK
jgi:hypothetical protein